MSHHCVKISAILVTLGMWEAIRKGLLNRINEPRIEVLSRFFM